DIQSDFTQRFVGVRVIHLVRATIAKLRWALGCIAKRPVKSRREFGRITHDPGLIETGSVECLANSANAAVHHVAWRHHIGARCGMGERSFNEKLYRLVVENMEMISVDARYATMAVAHVFAQAYVGNGNERRTFCFDGSQRPLNNPVFGTRGAGLFVFLFRNAEKKDGLQPEILNALCFIDSLLQRELK